MPNNCNSSTIKHYHSIDCLKGVLILFILLTHYTWKGNERLSLLFPFWIDMSVPLFMIISGFVYTKSFQKNNITTIDQAYTTKNILGKLIRYSIPFIIIFLAEEIVFLIIYNVKHSLRQIIIAFLTGGYGPGSYYYPIMIQFVFYFPIIYAIVRKYNFNGVILCGFINFIYEILKSAYSIPVESYRLLIFRYTLLIAYGCYMASANYIRHKKLSVLCTFLGIIYITLHIYINFQPLITRFWTGTSM